MFYKEDDCLPLSGIQHIAFCPRQFALIHVERLWQENVLTFEGRIMHDRADDPLFVESRGTVLISRSVPLISRSLGLYGVADVVEFHKCTHGGVVIEGRPGTWQPYPIEYKRGQVKPDDRDMVQLCAQAMCLEEMLGSAIAEGALFYGKTRRRQVVKLDSALRSRVTDLAREMHAIYESGITPPPSKTKACRSCSLVDLCLPSVSRTKSTRMYLRAMSREHGASKHEEAT
ncbi:MAG TPA: CRISPR-associated protein Cas4 [Firmicutes bacterium]|nr:CRISPR-associated protein Cas4 [Candidatus Fermentithermobacillaceae bacterium]